MAMPRLFAELMIDTPEIKLYGGEAENWPGVEHIDFVVTNPYGPIPPSLADTPMLIHQWRHKKTQAEEWIGTSLDFEVSTWNHGRESWWTANILKPAAVDVSSYSPEPIGWMPYDMVHTLLAAYVRPGLTIWDGFAGRGTIAKAARALGIKYVGVELLAKHVALAKKYLEIP